MQITYAFLRIDSRRKFVHNVGGRAGRQERPEGAVLGRIKKEKE